MHSWLYIRSSLQVIAIYLSTELFYFLKSVTNLFSIVHHMILFS
jgi:hypothetical protein